MRPEVTNRMYRFCLEIICIWGRLQPPACAAGFVVVWVRTGNWWNCRGRPPVALAVDQLEEHLHDLWIEVLPGLLGDVGEHFLLRPGLPVRPVG